MTDPYPAFARMRSVGAPVRDTDSGSWLAARHADVNAVLRHKDLGRIFTTREPIELWDTFNWLHADSILDSEPPKHTRLRRLVAQAFGRGHVERLRPRVRAASAGLLDSATEKLRDTGQFDLLADYAEPLPVIIIAELLGFPAADRPLLRPWSQDIVAMYELDRTPEQDDRAQRACAEFSQYVRELAADRTRHPGEDLLTDLAQARVEGERLSEQELIATAVLLLNAGHEASVNGFGNGVVALLQHPDQLAAVVADPWGLAPSTVEEMLRFDSPLHLFERTAKVDTEVAGVRLQAGDKISALLGSANRDPEVFAEPDSFDARRDPNPHLSFGVGIHFCLGAPLARVELTTSLPILLERLPGLQLAAAPVRRPSFVLRGYETLPVTG